MVFIKNVVFNKYDKECQRVEKNQIPNYFGETSNCLLLKANPVKTFVCLFFTRN